MDSDSNNTTDEPVAWDGPEADAVLNRSIQLWASALNAAEAMHTIPDSCTDLDSLLVGVPGMPRCIDRQTESIKGHLTWNNEDPDCNLKTRQGFPIRCWLRNDEPHCLVICRLSSTNDFCHWPGTDNNGLCFLVCAWAYVFNASLAERQGLDLKYVPRNNISKGATSVPDFDYATEEERLWWRSLVQQDLETCVLDVECPLPWTLRTEDLGISFTGVVPNASYKPPTAQKAASFVARFCARFGLGSQCTAALSVVLVIPLLEPEVGTMKPDTIHLPRPRLSASETGPMLQEHLDCKHFSQLDHCMTLSSTQRLGSALHSVLWAPGNTSCNYAGAVLGGIKSVIDPLIQENKFELLAKMMSPSVVAPFWLGMLLCGRTRWLDEFLSSLADLRRWGHPDLNLAEWICVEQSFLNKPSPWSAGAGRITRADVWRLRSECIADFEPGIEKILLPVQEPWAPFGDMSIADVDPEMQKHLACNHRWTYSHTTWESGEVDRATQPLRSLRCPGLRLPEDVTKNPDRSSGDATIMIAASKEATKRALMPHRVFLEPNLWYLLSLPNVGEVGSERYWNRVKMEAFPNGWPD